MQRIMCLCGMHDWFDWLTHVEQSYADPPLPQNERDELNQKHMIPDASVYPNMYLGTIFARRCFACDVVLVPVVAPGSYHAKWQDSSPYFNLIDNRALQVIKK